MLSGEAASGKFPCESVKAEADAAAGLHASIPVFLHESSRVSSTGDAYCAAAINRGNQCQQQNQYRDLVGRLHFQLLRNSVFGGLEITACMARLLFLSMRGLSKTSLKAFYSHNMSGVLGCIMKVPRSQAVL